MATQALKTFCIGTPIFPEVKIISTMTRPDKTIITENFLTMYHDIQCRGMYYVDKKEIEIWYKNEPIIIQL